MGASHVQVVGLDRNEGEDGIDERGPSAPVTGTRQLDADQELRCGDGRDCDVVVVSDDAVQRGAPTLRGDEHGRVENQPLQGRSSTVRAARSWSNSFRHAASGRFWRKSSLRSLPLAAAAGPMRATVRPRRATRKVSPRDSTASSSSEKRRAASVALRLSIRSDYQIQII